MRYVNILWGSGLFIVLFAFGILSAIAQEEAASTSTEAVAATDVVSADETAPAITIDQQEASSTGFKASRLTAGLRWSEDVQEYYADMLLPVWKTERTILFLDVRGTFLEDLEQELNAGLVVRRILPDKNVILGGNLFYDTRWTENDNTFDQVGAGIEILSRYVDVRFNYYYPLNDKEFISQSSQTDVSETTVANQKIITTTTTRFNTYEEAIEGYDAEIGFWIPFLEQSVPTALYAGYYNFSSDYDSDYSGVKVRLESRITPNFTVDAEWFEDDDLNRTEYFVGVRVHVPLDFWNGLQFKAPANDSGRHFMENRMNELVNRDFRIRTIVTPPVKSGQTIETSIENTSPTGNRSPQKKPPSNCRIDPITGDVICD